MGCNIGNRISVKQIREIVDLTSAGWFRSDIARKVGVNPWTVWKYQKQFELV